VKRNYTGLDAIKVHFDDKTVVNTTDTTGSSECWEWVSNLAVQYHCVTEEEGIIGEWEDFNDPNLPNVPSAPGC